MGLPSGGGGGGGVITRGLSKVPPNKKLHLRSL